MPHLYTVVFITDQGVIERRYEAETAQACMDFALDQFVSWNIDPGELEEIIVEPPAGMTFLPDMPGVLQLYWVTPEGHQAMRRERVKTTADG